MIPSRPVIRDLEEFRRLFRVNIPAPRHADYCLDTLAAPIDPRDLYFIIEHRLAQWVS